MNLGQTLSKTGSGKTRKQRPDEQKGMWTMICEILHAF